MEISISVACCDQLKCLLFTSSDDMVYNLYFQLLNFTGTAHFSRDHADRNGSFLVCDNLEEDLNVHNLYR